MDVLSVDEAVLGDGWGWDEDGADLSVGGWYDDESCA